MAIFNAYRIQIELFYIQSKICLYEMDVGYKVG